MIILQFKGRLGNQLFQYAAARKFAIDGETELKLDLRNYAPDPDAHRIRFFNIIENVATKEECDKLKNKDLLYYLEKILPYYKRRFVWERNWRYDKNLIGLKRKNMYTRGVFQSPEYFKGIEDLIRKEFTLKEPLSPVYDELIQKMQNTDSVSLHIRRGDIIEGGIQFEKTSLTFDYYGRAAAHMSKHMTEPHFFIFSDDIEWAKKNITVRPCTFVSGHSSKDYEELILMSRCKHNITGNSTFSWWGAWLNRNPEKIIINPEKWFQDKVENKEYTTHLIPSSWITLPN